jgi:hypothetical protein
MFQPNRNLWLGNKPRPFWMPSGESRSREHCGFLSPEVRQMGCGESVSTEWVKLHRFHPQEEWMAYGWDTAGVS